MQRARDAPSARRREPRERRRDDEIDRARRDPDERQPTPLQAVEHDRDEERADGGGQGPDPRFGVVYEDGAKRVEVDRVARAKVREVFLPEAARERDGV